MPGVHAILSASAAHRWLNCNQSALFEKQYEEQGSEYAAEGTFAHEVAEIKLGRALFDAGYWKERPSRRLNKNNEFWSVALEDYINGYVAEVMEYIASLKEPLVMLEQRLDFSKYVPGGFGTGDVVIVSDGALDVIDLKYGKGVPVSAERNPQLMLYGLGALETYDCLYDIETVRLHIKQPRLDDASSYQISAAELIDWAENEVAPKAELAMKGEGSFEAGEWCRFCKARKDCRARAKANLELAKYEFAPGPQLTDGEIGDILGKAGELKRWAEDIEAFALEQAEKNGKKWPGWKLVEGRSNRRYSDEGKIAEILLGENYREEDIFNKKLKGIGDMERLLGKKKFCELLAEQITKPQGKPTLVPENDKRPELGSIASAEKDFKEDK